MLLNNILLRYVAILRSFKEAHFFPFCFWSTFGIFSHTNDLIVFRKHPSQIVGEAEVDAAIDDEVFYDSQDHFDKDDFGDVPMTADEPGPSTSAAANRTNNSLSALANINPAWQKAAKVKFIFLKDGHKVIAFSTSKSIFFAA